MSLTSYRAAPPRAKCGPSKAKRKDKQNRGARDETPRCDCRRCKEAVVLGRPGNDLLSRVLRHSTIGAEEFNGRVRDGIGFFSSSLRSPDRPRTTARARSRAILSPGSKGLSSQPRSRTVIMRAIKPIEPLVPVSSTRHRAYTPGLSTWSSSTALKGGLVSRGVSRLDAFSGYPVRT